MLSHKTIKHLSQVWVFGDKIFCINIGNDITSMLLTQALQPLGCDDDDPPDENPPEFDIEFSPKV